MDLLNFGVENIQPEFNSSKILKFDGNVEICRNNFVIADEWLHSNIRFIIHSSLAFKNAIIFVKMKFHHMLLRDYKYFYLNQIKSPLWDTKHTEEFNSKYLNRKISLEYLRKMLINHYSPNSLDANGNIIDFTWKIAVYEFVKMLMLFLDKETWQI